MFTELEGINSRPEPFQYYTAEELWTDEHTSKQMLEYHLNDFVDASSRNKKFINRSVEWITSYENIYSDVTGSKYDSENGEMAIISKKAV